MTVKDVVAERFRQLCAQRGIKYNELANLSGITPSTVYSLLDVRRRDISITTIKSCATGWISRWASFSQRLNSTPWNRNYNKKPAASAYRASRWFRLFHFSGVFGLLRRFRRLFPFRQRRQHHRRRDHAPPQYCEPPCGVCVRCADRRIAEDTILHIRRQPGRYHQPAGDLDQQRCCPARQRPAEGHRPQQFCAITVPENTAPAAAPAFRPRPHARRRS